MDKGAWELGEEARSQVAAQSAQQALEAARQQLATVQDNLHSEREQHTGTRQALEAEREKAAETRSSVQHEGVVQIMKVMQRWKEHRKVHEFIHQGMSAWPA